MSANHYKTNHERMLELIEQLTAADLAYYQDDNPVMPDRDYDILIDELKSLEHDTGLTLSNSPTQKVSGEILDELTPVRHTKPMLSADKTKSVEDLIRFADKRAVMLSWKMDGLTLVLRYENGTLMQAITRGRDGIIGEDVTHTVRTFLNVPLTIPAKESFEVRGEGVVSWKNFDKLNLSLEEPYSHPRGLAAGSVRKLDAGESKKRMLEFWAFELVSDYLEPDSKLAQQKYLEKNGFSVVPYIYIDAEHDDEAIRNAIASMEPKHFGYPVDGLIMEYEDIHYGKSLGATGHHENRLIALKWKDELFETKFRGVELATTRIGMVSITGLFDPVEIDGTTVSRAYLHNLDIFDAFQFGVGDTISVYKANMIIPQIAQNATMSNMGEKAQVDMEYMCELTGKAEEEIFDDLKGVIFLNPLYEYGSNNFQKYLMADEYLSGNVREKLTIARSSARLYPEDYTVNVEALERVQPKDLSASEIAVRLGAVWIPPEIVQQFMFEILETPRYAQWNIKIHFSPYTSEWNIEGKSYDRSNVKAYSTYGTSRINAYKIFEETLNLKDVRIFDYIEDEEGRKKPVLNKKETAIAQSKQELIKRGFQDWIWSDPERREKLTKLYNEKYNSTRPREYDGSHITFNGMNPEIELREHQKNAVAHILYGGNTLLAHAVGAGKTYEMTAAAMEAKRLGLCSKSLFVVPNHLTEQWASEFLQLYPAANILVATKKDFETKNRKRFCGRIATGDYDAVIIGHSQFEKIPMSIERQRAILEQQLEEITNGIIELKANRGENFSVKQLQKSKKGIEVKLKKLNDQSRKDDVVTFEELGVDRLFIDESHYYKNLFLFGSVCVSTERLLPVSRRMWTTFCRAIRQGRCLQTLSLLLC